MSPIPKGKSFETRLRFGRDGAGKQLRKRFIILIDPASPDAAALAEEAERVMQTMASQLSLLGDAEKALETLTEAGRVAGDAKKLRALARVVELASARATLAAPAKAPGLSTFGEVAEAWVSGSLRERYPDHVREKTARGRKDDAVMLGAYLPTLGRKPIAEITDEDLRQAKLAIPKDLDPDTRIIYLKRLRSVFRFAAGPLDLIAAIPKEIATLPRGKKRNIFWFLYPDEEEALLACTKIPLCFRVLYGWLSRNGTRITETLMLDHGHLDLDRGRVHLEAEWTKTKRARFWDLEPDVVAALRTYRLLDGEPGPEARVFHAQHRKSMSDATVRERFREDLLRAGVSRPELHRTTPGSKSLRVHDLRGGFCTLARRRGKSVAWVMDRSGHESISQLEQYTRFVRHADEQGLPSWWAPMNQAIPELRFAARGVGQGWATSPRPSGKQASSAHGYASIEEAKSEPDQAKTPRNSPYDTPETGVNPPSGPAGFQGVGQAGPGSHSSVSAPQGTPQGPHELAQTDPVAAALAHVEAQLADAILEMARRGDPASVRILSAELEARRLSREAAAAKAKGVTSLDAARAKRDKGEGK